MPARLRRRAVGPRGATPAPTGPEPREPRPEDRSADQPDDDERLRADRPPHHDRGV